jgi:hypothetical protein
LPKIKDSEINNAIFGGVVSLAMVFWGVKDMIADAWNINFFLALIIVFILVSLIRVFGTISGAKKVNDYVVSIFIILGIPFTVFVLLRIFITQIINMETQLSPIPILISGIFLLYFAAKKLGYKFRVYKEKHKSRKKKKARTVNGYSPSGGRVD